MTTILSRVLALGAAATASLALASPAMACEGPTHRTQCHLDERDDGDNAGERFIDSVEFELAGGVTAMPRTLATGVSGRFTGLKDSWLGAEGRWTQDGRWTARLSTGVDLLGEGPWDLRGGLFLGNVGVWQTAEEQVLMIGTELAAAGTIGRVTGEYRFIGGKRPQERGVRTESTVTVSYRLADDLRISGHWLALNGGDGQRAAGVGLGASYTF